MVPTRTSSSPGLTLLFWGGVFLLWGGLLAAFLPAVLAESRQPGVSPTETWALVGVGVGSSVIWLGGIRHLAMWALAARSRRPPTAPPRHGGARVALVYCTSDDANFDALRCSMAQDHAVTTVILDDSMRAATREAVDDFASRSAIDVIRRPDRVGYKAGSLNHGLPLLMSRFDFFVVLDSDEILPGDFVSRALADFAVDEAIGIVQGRHRALPGGTRFSSAFAGMLESHVSVAQNARSRVGLSVFMGRGAMISADCLRAAGPLPELVTEDVAFTIEARIAGFEIHYDHDLVSLEDFPVDYHAFRTQHTKTVAGTTEFLMASWSRIARSRLRLSEKLDVIIEQMLTPAIGVAALTLLVSGIVLAASGGEAAPPIWAILATGVFGMSALLPEAVRVLRTRGVIVAARFLAGASALYGSMLLVTLNTTIRVLLGRKAVFVVTPKKAATGGLRSAAGSLRLEIAAAVVVVVIALTLSGSLAPAMPVVGPASAAVCFATAGLLHERRSRPHSSRPTTIGRSATPRTGLVRRAESTATPSVE